MALSFSVANVMEDVLQQHDNRSRELDLDSRRAEEAATRRYEATVWIRKMIGVVGARDLPAEPSEEEFRLALRSGQVLCYVINKVEPGAVTKVVEGPCDSASVPDGAALSIYQCFENVRNFLVAVEQMGLPTFEASDLEQGGKSSRIVNCVLALKSFHEWKQTGANGVWKFGGNVKPVAPSRNFIRKNSEPFKNSLSRNISMNETSMNAQLVETENSKMPNSSLNMLVRAVLMDKKPDEVPVLVESVLSKVMEEFENRIANQFELKNASAKDAPTGNKTFLKPTSDEIKVEDKKRAVVKKNQNFHENSIPDEEKKRRQQKYQMLFDIQEKDIKDLKQTLSIIKSGMQFMQMKFHDEIQNFGMHVHGLANAASGYHRVLEENRKLYNQVQDLKGNIRVYCRVRPGKLNLQSVVDNIEEGTITINTPAKYGKGCRSFNFNKVFGPSATQAEVFADTRPLIRSVLDGYNVCIFAYGQTGSGKTHTMTGPKDLTEDSQGVNYRALSDLFFLAEQRKDTFEYNVSVQMIEIYNEQVRDLLATEGLNKRLEIRNNSQNGFNVPDASLVQVASMYDVIELMNLGQRNRAVGATALNDRSSRSHSCLTVHVQGKDLTSGNVLRGCMHLVDLAGSERVDKSEVAGDRLKEAQHINKSLSALGDVISSLAQKNSHVPYRNSKLTQLLQDSLGGQAKTLMFVHISPEVNAVGETLSTLKFAERVATVELGAAQVHKDSSDVKDLKEQIANLKAALAKKEGDQENVQHKVSGSPGGKLSSRSPPILQQIDSYHEPKNRRKPRPEVSNAESGKKSRIRQKTQSFDLDELLANSPPWPPVSGAGEAYLEDDRDTGSADWVDKVMVNKQDAARCWETENAGNSDAFYQKYVPDSSKLYSEQSYTVFEGGSGFEIVTTDGVDELDAATSDSSEPDLLWQFNHSKLPTMSRLNNNSTGKPTKSPDLRSMIPRFLPSPSRKATNVGSHPQPPVRGGRQVTGGEMKKKTGNRKQ
ncbi:putative minus-end-directed kinesin ATPase [Helianthus annuus]|nr:putative minus-end-directed kinesin ATPase [Helianthus annuus]KAJ0762055.1 putative minus-end-directed kinesin ATPase [Helianthus annuus]KAJ0927780.1 putative minus-end-directed kinesin ATPase [Helianthus annuus]